MFCCLSGGMFMDGNGVDRVDVSELKSLFYSKKDFWLDQNNFLFWTCFLEVDTTEAANAVITSSFDKKQRDDSRFSLFPLPTARRWWHTSSEPLKLKWKGTREKKNRMGKCKERSEWLGRDGKKERGSMRVERGRERKRDIRNREWEEEKGKKGE